MLESTVEADASLMRVVLENLLDNAWKYTRRTPEAVVEFGQEDVDGQTVYFVRDNGVGFDMAYVDKLFRPFERLHRSRDFEGTGIGLAIVHKIVAKHGGSVWARSAVGEGATVYFSLGRAGG